MDGDGEIDLLALLEDSTVSGLEVVIDVEGCARVEQHPSPSVASTGNANASQDQAHHDNDVTVSVPNMVGKVGGGRHGDSKDRSLLGLHMRHCKALKRETFFREGVAQLLDNSTFRKDGHLIGVRATRTSAGVTIRLSEKSMKGNRFKKAIPWIEFLQAAYGRFRRDTHISMNLDVSRSTARFMTIMVGSTYLGQQCSVIGKLISLAESNPPMFLLRHLKWDEATIWTSANADKDERRVASAWGVMVSRQRIILGWSDGTTAVLRVVMPPVILLAGGAHHVYYSMKYHPMFKAVQHLLDMLGTRCFHRAEILEADGAYANERLIAHLLQKNKVADLKYHIVHGRCQSHQSQLINVALLAAMGSNILSRLYGLTVFIRNLGNWLRLKQSLHTWLDQRLVFHQDTMEPFEQPSTHASILELVDFLRCNRKIEAENPDGDVSSAFDSAVKEFLRMFNGNGSLNTPCHHCTHTAFPLSQRCCSDRQDAVRKCAKALLTLFMSAMPSVPAPNKWTTLFPSLDA